MPRNSAELCGGPCSYKYGGELGVQIVSYSTPTTPGNCRVLFAVVMDRRTAPKRTMQLLDLKPAWLKFMDHYERNTVLDGDNCFLHMQVSLSAAYDLHVF